MNCNEREELASFCRDAISTCDKTDCQPRCVVKNERLSCKRCPYAASRTESRSPHSYVVQTNEKVIQRCIMMTTDPGDLALDPTGGSGITAYVGEQWGRRWITIDVSRVALVLARARIMGARYPWYLLADSREGQRKEAEIARRAPS